MKVLSLLAPFVLFSLVSEAQGEPGKCIALGRVGGEGEVCAQFDNTSREVCEKADGWAWCAWKPSTAREPAGSAGNGLKILLKNLDEVKTFVYLGGGDVEKDLTEVLSTALTRGTITVGQGCEYVRSSHIQNCFVTVSPAGKPRGPIEDRPMFHSFSFAAYGSGEFVTEVKYTASPDIREEVELKR